MVELSHANLSLRQQCELLTINRSGFYYQERPRAIDEITLMKLIRDAWLSHPFYGYRRITATLNRQGTTVTRKRVQRLMKVMGLQALRRKPNTSQDNKAHQKYPYLLGEMNVIRSNQAWMVDITYLRGQTGFYYLVALIDVHSRYIVGWSLSNKLDTENCLNALSAALDQGCYPDVINSDQGVQFTSKDWINTLDDAGVSISMTGKGRCHDNIFIERFWRSLKHEEIYLNDYDEENELRIGIEDYIQFYNNERPHQSLDYQTPAQIYDAGELEVPVDMCTNQPASLLMSHTYPQAEKLQ
jgi:putative transposase